MTDMNTCDKCGIRECTHALVWIDAEDFEPLKRDKFKDNKYRKALKKGYSALCEKCYQEECCYEA